MRHRARDPLVERRRARVTAGDATFTPDGSVTTATIGALLPPFPNSRVIAAFVFVALTARHRDTRR